MSRLLLLILVLFGAPVYSDESALLTTDEYIRLLAPSRGFVPEPVQLYVNFDFDSAVLDERAKSVLDQLGPALDDPYLRRFFFEVGGHTDSVGSYEYNKVLSYKRSNAVKSYLTKQFNLQSDQLEAVGYGPDQLKYPESPTADANRRVEIRNLGRKQDGANK